jgi:hypothetical protein
MQHNSNRTIDFLFMKQLTKNRKIENRNNTVIVINHYDVIFFHYQSFNSDLLYHNSPQIVLFLLKTTFRIHQITQI